MAATAKVILLKGDKSTLESQEHIIKFPGGSISVCRTSSDEYWAHIEVNRGEVLEGDSFRESKAGEIVEGRMDYNRPPGQVNKIQDLAELQHIAVRIKTL